MSWLLRYLPGQKNTKDDEVESDSESASSEGTFDDCINDQESDPEDKQTEKKASSTANSVNPPPSSIATEVESTDLTEARLAPQDATDDFVQTNTPLLQQFSKSSSFGQTNYSVSSKNELQTICQRQKANLPIYGHTREGPDHAPKFRAAVVVNGVQYESPENFKYSSKGEAEQAAAKVALSQLQDLPDVKRKLNAAPGQSKVVSSIASSSTGASNLTVKSIKTGGQVNPYGQSAEAPIDLTDEQSIGSPPPFSVTSSPKHATPSDSALSSYQEFWGPFNKDGASFKGVSNSSQQKQKPSSSDCQPVIDKNVIEIAGKFSELQVTSNRAVEKAALPPTQSRSPWQPQSATWAETTLHSQALGKLDFASHVFPLLTRLNGQPLEERYDVRDIELLQQVPANEVFEHLSQVDRERGRDTTLLRPPRGDGDPRSLLYDCYINPNGKKRFEVSENMQGSNLLQREIGFDRVLRVFFESSYGPMPENKTYKDIAKTGIFVGPRLYQYFVHKPADDITNDEEKKSIEGPVRCYFVCIDSQGEKDQHPNFRKYNTIVDARRLFMHIQTCASIATYIVRMQLCLSKTITITMPWDELVIKVIDDLTCEDKAAPGALFTDGTGFISSDLVRGMPMNVFQGMVSEMMGQGNDIYEDHPTLLQVRIFDDGAAYKGTLLAVDDLPPKTIYCYRSMQKVERDPKVKEGLSIKSFELVSTSRNPRRARLSQDLIALLTLGKVPGSVFLEAVDSAIVQEAMILTDRRRAYQAVMEWDSDRVETPLRMIAANIPLDEPGLHKFLIDLKKNSLQDFTKGKVPLEGSFYLMGTADPTHTLNPDEVVVFKGEAPVYGTVLVYRAPGKHPGDIHKVKAVHCPKLKDYVRRPKNVIFFSTLGNRPLPHEIAKGDLDGDLYWICENPKVTEPFMERRDRWYPGEVCSEGPGQATKAPMEFPPAKLEEALFHEYYKAQFLTEEELAVKYRSVVGLASFHWSLNMEVCLHPDTSPQNRKLHEQECLKYIDYIYEGVDIKSGKQLNLPKPRFSKLSRPPYLMMKKGSRRGEEYGNVENGNGSILTDIYHRGQKSQEQWVTPTYRLEQFEVHEAFVLENSKEYIPAWESNFKNYLREMSQALEGKDGPEYDKGGPDRVNLKYKMMLYGAPSFDESKKELQKIFQEASAICQVVYKKAWQNQKRGSPPSFAFAWNIAGAPLAAMFARKNHIVWSQSAYIEVHKRLKSTGYAPIRPP